jgi:hypothetical protein
MLHEHTTELLTVLNVPGPLVKRKPKQGDPLNRICARLTISADDLKAAAPQHRR